MLLAIRHVLVEENSLEVFHHYDANLSSSFLIAQVAERQARDLEVRGSNPGPGSNFSLEFKF